jgi:hypothetical protein
LIIDIAIDADIDIIDYAIDIIDIITPLLLRY